MEATKKVSAAQSLVNTITAVVIVTTFHRKPNGMRVLTGETHTNVLRQFQAGRDAQGNTLDHITKVYDGSALKGTIVKVNGHYEFIVGETKLIGLSKGYDILFFTEEQCKAAKYEPKAVDAKAEDAAAAYGV